MTADHVPHNAEYAGASEAEAGVVVMDPYYEADGITIYHGDCGQVLCHLDPVDIVVTSPPYNMGLVPGGNGRGMYRPGANTKAGRFRDGYDGTNDDAMPYDGYCQWQRAVLAQCWDLARMAIFYNHRPRVEHGLLRPPLDLDFGLPLRQIIVWDRGTGVDVNLRSFCTRQEWVLLFARPEFRLVSRSASGMGDVWRLGMETGITEHPAPFPVSLPARCIEATAAGSVLDPFMGSGSTLVAAKAAGIRAIGIEKSERFCELAARRLAQGSLFGGEHNDPALGSSGVPA